MSSAPRNMNMKSYQPFQIVDQSGRPSFLQAIYPPCRAILSRNSLGVSFSGSPGLFLAVPATANIHS